MWTAGYKSSARGRWRRQDETELKMEKSGLWPVPPPQLEAINKSRKQAKLNTAVWYTLHSCKVFEIYAFEICI